MIKYIPPQNGNKMENDLSHSHLMKGSLTHFPISNAQSSPVLLKE